MTEHSTPSLLALLAELKHRHYRFTTITPASHRRVLARPDRREARQLADVLGWSLPFRRDLLDAELLRLLEDADLLEPAGEGLLHARVRVSSLRGELYLHSAFPTESEDSVFFGPDSYRFADLIAHEFAEQHPAEDALIVDIGTGAGVGAIVAGKLQPKAELVVTDVNPKALRLAAINAEAAGLTLHLIESDTLDPVEGAIDIALANPPYIIDAQGRDYRDGGGMHGGAVALSMAEMAMTRLAPGGRLILYTGAAIVRGEDELHEALARSARERGCTMRYRELDPDVFGEELEAPAYEDVDRIAVVAALFERSQ